MKINFEKSIEPSVKKFKKNAIEIGEKMRYTLNDADIGTDIFTRSCNSCTAVALNAGEHTYLAHIDPKYFNWKTFTQAFKTQVDKFQDRFGDAKALILGGWEQSRIDPKVSTPSAEVYATIAGILDEMPLTMICGKKSEISTFDNLFASKNKITIANNIYEKLGITSEKVKNMSAEQIEKELQKAYEWVEIDPSML